MLPCVYPVNIHYLNSMTLFLYGEKIHIEIGTARTLALEEQ